MKVVIAGGGTAGHVNPAIALATALEGHDVTFLGTATGAEARLVPAAGGRLETIDVRGFDRARPLSLPATGARALRAIAGARRILAEAGADAVVGMGGYVSLPASLAARSLKVPVVLHEQNIVLGLANRVSRPFARSVAVSFEETLAQAGPRGVLVGNPVLPGLVEADWDAARIRGIERWRLDPARRTVLVFGGSQGAGRINEAGRGLALLWKDRADRQIVHISGSRGFGAAAESVIESDLVYRTVEVVADMAEAYAVADLALCRGGATTVAELAVAGLPAVIVPYPYHRDRQQERHGRVLERAGAARVLPDADAIAPVVARVLDELMDDATLKRMAGAALARARPEAAARLAEIVEGAAA